MNNTMSKFMSPSGIYEGLKSMADDIAGVTSIEGQVLLDQFGKVANQMMSKMGSTWNEIFKEFAETVIHSIIEFKKQNQSLNFQEYMTYMNNKKAALTTDLKLRGQHAMNQANQVRLHGKRTFDEFNQTGGTTEDEFMKYVYTEKPIWFTKKDMIWN